MHDVSLIATIAAGLTSAWVLGLLTQWLRLSPIVGYLLAGVLIGPYTPGFVGDLEIAQQLAELGVILLMFGVGLHFHINDLLAVKHVAIPGAVGPSLVATALAVVVFREFGLPVLSGAMIGMAMAVASTVVLMRVLMDANVLESPQGHVAVGWLIVEDIFTVVILVLIPVLAHGEEEVNGALKLGAANPTVWVTLGGALWKLISLVVIVMLAGSRIIPWVLVRVAKLRSRELFTLTVLVFSIAIAAGSYFFFGASMALGAFLAGMVVAQSPVSHHAAADALPLRDAFAVLFFVSVGMLFDPTFLIQQPLMIIAALGIIMIVKPIAALTIVALVGQSARIALTVALGLAQIGEFSFNLSDMARRHGLMPDTGHNLLVASAIISITLNPLLFRSLPAVESWLRRQPRLWSLLNGRTERKASQLNLSVVEPIRQRAAEGQGIAIVIGFGPVGRAVHRLLKDADLPTVVIDLNLDTVANLNSAGQIAVFGDASHEAILRQAGIVAASYVVLTLPNSSDRAAVVAAVRNLNSSARLLVRARYLRERNELERSGATAAVFEEAEAAIGLARLVLADTGVHRAAAERKVHDLRLQLIMENMSNFGTQRVGSVMVPWSRVRRLNALATKERVLARLARDRYTRWPVVEPTTGQVIGYLLAKDLISPETTDHWCSLVRPLHAVHPEDDLESIMARMQCEGATIYVVQLEKRPSGLITLEDILEQVVGRIEDEYPHDKEVSLGKAVESGGIIMKLSETALDHVIRELAAGISEHRLPASITHAQISEMVLAREEQVSTDLGNGVAIPHTRLDNLPDSLPVFGRSIDGVMISPESDSLVRLFFLLLTPADEPEIQLSLLQQIATLVDEQSHREQLLHAMLPEEIEDLLREWTPRRH